MKKIFLAVACVAMACITALLSACTTSPDTEIPTGGTEEAASKFIVGYLPDWAYYSYEQLEFGKLTHLNLAFCNPTSDGGISCGIPDGHLNQIVQKAHDEQVKVIAALGGGGYCDQFRPILADQTRRIALNEAIEAYCETYGLDGIDLDIELNASDTIWNDYGTWVKELRAICDGHGWLLSTATAQWVAYNVSEETFALFDYLNVMAYDDETHPSSHASYQFTEECLNYFETQKNVAKERLVLGVPFYGRGYTNGALDWNSYVSFKELIASNEALYHADVDGNGVAYNGAETMTKKCDLAKAYGGIMIWEITLDATGEYSLLDLIHRELTETERS